MGEATKDPTGITEGFVQQQLAQRFIGLAHTHVAPGAQLHLPWIADLITVTRTGMVVENEIKLNKADQPRYVNDGSQIIIRHHEGTNSIGR